MKITNALQTDSYNLFHGIQDYGIKVLAEESTEESIKATLEQKQFCGVVTLSSVNESMNFTIHRLRPSGDYIKESFKYDPSSQKWHFKNAVAFETSDLKKIFNHIFSKEHENWL